MKKKIFSIILAVCLIIPCAILAACGGAKPYDVKGKTFTGTKEAVVIWEEGVTAEQKQTYFDEEGGETFKNEEELVAYLSKQFGGYIEGIKFTYNEDGTVKIVFAGEDSDLTGYYVQSEDLKDIKHYRTAEHVEGDIFSDGVGSFKYVEDGKYGVMLYEEEGLFKAYIAFKEAE